MNKHNKKWEYVTKDDCIESLSRYTGYFNKDNIDKLTLINIQHLLGTVQVLLKLKSNV